jgi:hypothetical protein
MTDTAPASFPLAGAVFFCAQPVGWLRQRNRVALCRLFIGSSFK